MTRARPKSRTKPKQATLTTRPAKPSLGIGTATVTLAYSDLTGLLGYVAGLETYAAGLEAAERAREQEALSGDREAMAATLRAAIEVARFPVGYFHPGSDLGSYIPSEAYRVLADGLVRFFGPAAPEAVFAQAYREYAKSADDYREYRKEREVAWWSPCATCGCPREAHLETLDPLERGMCAKHSDTDTTPVCIRYVPSAEMPPLPGI